MGGLQTPSPPKQTRGKEERKEKGSYGVFNYFLKLLLLFFESLPCFFSSYRQGGRWRYFFESIIESVIVVENS